METNDNKISESRMNDIADAAKYRKFPRFNEYFLNSVENPELIETTLSLAFMEGAKWADQNPSEDLIERCTKITADFINNKPIEYWTVDNIRKHFKMNWG